jgi:DEPDC5 protein C-terminal region
VIFEILGPNYKHTHLDIDVANKSDRIEWGHAKYQPAFRSDRAYEFSVQWVAATGTVVSDLVSELIFCMHFQFGRKFSTEAIILGSRLVEESSILRVAHGASAC